MTLTRRTFVKATGTAVAAGLVGAPQLVLGASKKVVVVGGGTGGATVAKYLKRADPGIDVTLIEANQHYFTGYFSNEVISGHRTMDSIRFDYAGLTGRGINLVHDVVVGIDAVKRIVTTKDGGNTRMTDVSLPPVSTIAGMRLKDTIRRSRRTRFHMPGMQDRRPCSCANNWRP